MKSKDIYVITLEGRPRSDQPDPIVKCTCGWQFGPSDSMMALGTMAFNHRDETGHELRDHSDGVKD